MKCKYCGENNSDTNYYCSRCGRRLPAKSNVLREHTILAAIISTIFPPVGLIFFILFRDTRPKTSKTSKNFAILGLVLHFIFFALLFAGILNFIFSHQY